METVLSELLALTVKTAGIKYPADTVIIMMHSIMWIVIACLLTLRYTELKALILGMVYQIVDTISSAGTI